jgi:uncharacterized protein
VTNSLRITVLGGTGHTGAALLKEATARGHQVTAYSRNAPAEPVPGVTYVQASLTEPAVRREIVSGADVVISALSPRGDMAGTFAGIFTDLAALADEAKVRLGVVGGFGSLRATEGGPRIFEGPDFSDEYRPESQEMFDVHQILEATPETLDFFYVSPAGIYGPWAPGTPTGTFRVGGEVALFDDNGQSTIGVADFATAVIDEVEKPAHRRGHFGVAY